MCLCWRHQRRFGDPLGLQEGACRKGPAARWVAGWCWRAGAHTGYGRLATGALPHEQGVPGLFLLVAHFRVAPGLDPREVLDQAGEPVRLLAAQPDTVRLRWARSTEDAGHLVLTAEFATAATYRRALSPMPVRTIVIPWLSAAEVATSGVHEVLLAADGGVIEEPEIIVPEPRR